MEICALCDKRRELQLSHIVPKFVFTWHKKNTSNHLRSSEEPNKRVQDGLKEYLLCCECEQKFSSWEDKFAREVFRPINKGDFQKTKYSDWALKFAVSVSFRALTYYKRKGLSHFSSEQLQEAEIALQEWKEFLLGNQPHPGKYEQHLIPLDVIESHSIPNPSPFFNRYITSTVDTDPIAGDRVAFIYVKMFKCLLIGHIKQDKQLWRETKIHVKNGIAGGKVNYAVPDYLFEYMNNKANHVFSLGDNISPTQKSKIAESFDSNLDKIINSPVGEGIVYDFKHSGESAFNSNRKK